MRADTEDEAPFMSIPDWQREILAERLAHLESNPEEEEQSWEEVKAELWPNLWG
jgi:hypothetical protein